MGEKTISRSAYVWGHIAVILFHIAISCVMISFYFRDRWNQRDLEITAVTLGSIMLVMSLLSLVPILKVTQKIVIPK